MDEDIRGSETTAPNDVSQRKEWLTPALRRLAIEATGAAGDFNQGVGKGKGKSGPHPVS